MRHQDRDRTDVDGDPEAAGPERQHASGTREERAQPLRPDADPGPDLDPFPPAADPMR